MQSYSAIDQLVPAMESSLCHLETFMNQHPSDLVRTILRRRRRAGSTLRTLLRWSGRPAVPTRGPIAPKGHVTLQILWQNERNLISLYDEALANTPAFISDTGLLSAQRAEADQAFLVLSAELNGNA